MYIFTKLLIFLNYFFAQKIVLFKAKIIIINLNMKKSSLFVVSKSTKVKLEKLNNKVNF